MANTSTSYDLGLLKGNTWRQWADASGLVYYQNLVTQVTTFELPASWEDVAGDAWLRDPTKTWPQWNNERTGRARLTDPSPPPPTTYLTNPFVKARISVLERTPEILEPMCRRLMEGILQWIFTSNEGFSVFLETMTLDMHPDVSVFRVLARPGGSLYEYDFLLGETKVPGTSWETFAAHLHKVCASCDNDTRNVYGMLQIGFEVQFYKHENY